MKFKIFTYQDNDLKEDVNYFLKDIPKEKIYRIDTFWSGGAGTSVAIYYEE